MKKVNPLMMVLLVVGLVVLVLVVVGIYFTWTAFK